MGERGNSYWWGRTVPPDDALIGDRHAHRHVSNALCIAFVALRSIPECAKDVQDTLPPGALFHTDRDVWRLTRFIHWDGDCQGLYLIRIMSGLGHPDCSVCHERYAESKAMGLHEARSILRAASGHPQVMEYCDSVWRFP